MSWLMGTKRHSGVLEQMCVMSRPACVTLTPALGAVTKCRGLGSSYGHPQA